VYDVLCGLLRVLCLIDRVIVIGSMGNMLLSCRAHHPRVNEAVHLLQQVTAALHLPLYQEHVASGGSGSSSQQRGCLRYVQLTAVPSQPGGRAEDDAQAQIQVGWWLTALQEPLFKHHSSSCQFPSPADL